MTDLYRLITDEQWEQIPRHERAGYVVSGGVMVKVKPTDRICTTHKSYASEWIEGKEQCAERGFLDKFGMTNPCNVVDMVRVEDV